MMNSVEFLRLENALRARYRNVDIRSDQCDTIRLLSPSVVAGCRYADGWYRAEVVSLEIETDLDTKLLATLQEPTEEGLVNSLAKFFES